MSAAILRQAAALMRERAQAATPGPWRETHGMDWRALVLASDKTFRVRVDGVPDATHIASWHPAVALAVAKMLDQAADAVESADICLDCFHPTCLAVGEAWDVARAYLATP